METRLSRVGCPLNSPRSSVHSCGSRSHRCIFYNLGFHKIVTIACQVLFPDQHRIISLGFCIPLGIYSGTCCQWLSKGEFFGRVRRFVRLIFNGVPTSKGITQTDHIFIVTRLFRNTRSQHKLRGIVFCALSVLIKHQPYTCRRIHRKSDITADYNFFIVGIKGCWCITTCLMASYNFIASALHIPSY